MLITGGILSTYPKQWTSYQAPLEGGVGCVSNISLIFDLSILLFQLNDFFTQ